MTSNTYSTVRTITNMCLHYIWVEVPVTCAHSSNKSCKVHARLQHETQEETKERYLKLASLSFCIPMSEILGSFPWTASRFSLVPWLPSAPITCSFEEMVPGKRARRLEFTIVIVSNVEGEVESDCYRKHSGGLSLSFRHHWGRPEWRAKQLK